MNAEVVTFQALVFAYHLALAVIVGGGLALGAFAAPALFKELPRPDAATAFGEALRRYDGAALVAAIVAILTAWIRAVNYETVDERHWLRFAALVVMAGATVYASAYANPVARQFRRATAGFDDLPEGHPARREFAKLHAASRRAGALAVLAGLVALFLS
ncbi:MAG TPA: DUF4149 domain-containing protein [Candidatus Limnocylindria bacterium]|nr:DUF4149 domain-containing protein [Candidatus Limnocylindria bacterium]